MNRAHHDRMTNAIRALAMDAVQAANSGHPGLPMGAADIATVLFTQVLKFDPADPKWPDRDRFVLSAGHGSMLVYSLLHLLGYESVSLDQIKKFRQLGSMTPGHPENFITPGIETTTGPLGQGLANAVGMAIAERHLAAEYGDDIVNHSTYVLASDGDLMEGISQEAIALRGPSEAQQADRAVRRQRHLHRRAAVAVGLGRSGEALRIRRLERVADRRPRSRSDCRRDREGEVVRQADHDRLQDHDRLRRADQGRQVERRTARRSAPTRSRARGKSSAGPMRRSRSPPKC